MRFILISVTGRDLVFNSDIVTDHLRKNVWSGFIEVWVNGSPMMFPHVCVLFLNPPPPLLCGRAAWAGSSDAKCCRGASVALGRLRAHRGSAAHPYLCLLLHWKGKTQTHTGSAPLQHQTEVSSFESRVSVLFEVKVKLLPLQSTESSTFSPTECYCVTHSFTFCW